MSKTLTEITTEIRNMMFERQDRLDAGEEISKEFDEKLKELMNFEGQKIDRCVSFIRMAEHQQTWLKSEMDHIKKEMKKYDRAIEGMKQIAKNVMLENGITEMTGEKGHKFRIRHDQKVKVTNLDLLPDKFTRQKITVEPDKVAIKKAIKEGWKVEGAELEETTSVVVK